MGKPPDFVMMHLPQDAELLAAFGRVTLSHGHLDHVLKRTVKTLARLSPQESDRALARENSASVRQLVKKFAESNFGKASAVTLKLKALLHQCECATEKRNRLVHSVAAQVLDGDAALWVGDSLEPMPKADELNALAAEISALARQLNDARLQPGGFVYDAMELKKGPGAIAAMKSRED